jgi:hypothetical protein
MSEILTLLMKEILQNGFYKTNFMLYDKTPIEVLQKEIEGFRRFQKMCETKKDQYDRPFQIEPERKEEVEANLAKTSKELDEKIKEFEEAISLIRKPILVVE